jgi:hypothetical protein
VPPSVAPPCVAGANNATDPGRGEAGITTGDGQNVIDNLEPLLASGDLRIDSTSPSRIVSIDVNLGPSVSGVEGSNPFEGMTPEQANRAMYWPGAFDPDFVEVGPRGRVVATAIRYAIDAAYGSGAARRSFHLIMKNASVALKTEIFNELEAEMTATIAHYSPNIPHEVKVILNELSELVFELIEKGPIDGPATPADAAGDYTVASSESSTPGNGSTSGSRAYGQNKGVCGQVQKSVAAAAPATATIAPDADWARITLHGTTHGTLVDKLKAMKAPGVVCPPVRAEVTAGQAASVIVGAGCAGAGSSLRVLNRLDISRLPSSQLAALLRSASEEIAAGSIFQFDFNEFDHAERWPDRNATAVFANGRVGFADGGASGRMNYQAPVTAGGLTDHVVVAAADSSGVEHPFLVTVDVKAQPTCSADDRPAGPEAAGFRVVVQDGSLQLLRNRPFVLSPRLLCEADPRDTYRVTVEGSVPGTTSTIQPDGTVLFDWTDPDVVGGEVASLTVTAWDEVTGVPSAPVTIPVSVRDVAPLCNDVEIEYDISDQEGRPLKIPVDCGMTGGLSVLSEPFLGLQTGTADPTELEVEGGVFTSDGASLLFTPNDSGTELSTAVVTPSTIDPRLYSHYRVRGPGFSVDVRLRE